MQERTDGCDIFAPSINWPEAFPPRSLNFWTGSLTCPPQEEIAELSEEGILNVFGCGDQPAEVTLLPSTKNWELDRIVTQEVSV